ncbi:MAG: signal peptidase II [Candidatus Methylacidiphilales bacterium]|nr:signal peptidase II [Candidatus Methylacidiphilales bacterium]
MSLPSDSAPAPAAVAAVLPRRYPRALFFFLLAGLYLLDQATKYWAEYSLAFYEPQPAIHIIPGFFSLHYVQNRGVAFGMMADQTVAMMLISAVLFIAGLYYASVLDWNQLETNVAGAMLFSGALGNITDRLAYGYVIDFLHFYWGNGEVFSFPVFNVADSAICISVGYIFLRQMGIWESRVQKQNFELRDPLKGDVAGQKQTATDNIPQ